MIKDIEVAAARFAPKLNKHAEQGSPLRDARDRQCDIGDERVLAAVVPERQQSLEDREPGSGDEDAERGEQ